MTFVMLGNMKVSGISNFDLSYFSPTIDPLGLPTYDVYVDHVKDEMIYREKRVGREESEPARERENKAEKGRNTTQ